MPNQEPVSVFSLFPVPPASTPAVPVPEEIPTDAEENSQITN